MQAGVAWAQTIDDARAAVRVHDYSEAASIYESLALSGDTEAAYQLASMYRAGRGVDLDYEVAIDWMTRAALAGDARAQYSLGQWLQRSVDNPGDQVEARGWFEKAASNGSGHQHHLPELLLVSIGFIRFAHDRLQI